MSYDVYWVKNRAEKIADFEHPTFRGIFFNLICLPILFVLFASSFYFPSASLMRYFPYSFLAIGFATSRRRSLSIQPFL